MASFVINSADFQRLRNDGWLEAVRSPMGYTVRDPEGRTHRALPLLVQTLSGLVPVHLGDWVDEIAPDTAETHWLDPTVEHWKFYTESGYMVQRSQDTWQAMTYFRYIEDPEMISTEVRARSIIRQRLPALKVAPANVVEPARLSRYDLLLLPFP